MHNAQIQSAKTNLIIIIIFYQPKNCNELLNANNRRRYTSAAHWLGPDHSPLPLLRNITPRKRGLHRLPTLSHARPRLVPPHPSRRRILGQRRRHGILVFKMQIRRRAKRGSLRRILFISPPQRRNGGLHNELSVQCIQAEAQGVAQFHNEIEDIGSEQSAFEL